MAWHRARELEFSCTTMPSYPQSFYGLFPFKGRGGCDYGGAGGRGEYGGLDTGSHYMARAFKMMSADVKSGVATATPPPMVAWILGRSLEGLRPLRVTDSPFPVVPEDCSNERVDAECDDFIPEC